jgi:hypothetical protein
MRDSRAGGNKKEKAHRLWDIGDVSPVGHAQWEYHSKVYDAKFNVEGCDKALFAKGPAWLDSELKMVRQRINVIRKSFVDGLRVVLKRERINSELSENVECAYALDGTGKQLRRGANCIEVGDRKSRAHAFITYGQLMKLDTVKAAKTGGTYEALMSTIARKPKEKQAATAPVKMPETKEEAYSMVNMLSHFFDANSEDGRKRIAAVLAEAQSNSEGSEAACEAIGSLYLALDGIWPKIENRYNKLQGDKDGRHAKPAKLAKAS